MVGDIYPTPYAGLCSAIAELERRPCFTLFISAYTPYTLGPPLGISSSSSVRMCRGVDRDPFTTTPFACHPSFPAIPANFTLADTARIGFPVGFGRPLSVHSRLRLLFLVNIALMFWALYGNYDGLESNHPLKIAVEELTNSPYSTIFTAEPKPAAVLDQRLRLIYDQRRPSVRMIEEKQVSKHVRLVYSVPQHGEFVNSGYSSEPFLAEVDAHPLSAWRQNYGRISVETLADGIGGVLSTRVDTGELVGRLILYIGIRLRCGKLHETAT